MKILHSGSESTNVIYYNARSRWTKYYTFDLYYFDCFQELNKLAEMVRGDLQKLHRTVLCSLITIDVHARDNITILVNERVTKR